MLYFIIGLVLALGVIFIFRKPLTARRNALLKKIFGKKDK